MDINTRTISCSMFRLCSLTILAMMLVAYLGCHCFGMCVKMDNKVLETVTFDYAQIKSIRERVKAHDKKIEKSYSKLLAEADDLLDKVSEKVTDGDLPPSNDRHDFFTIGKFSWPNPKTPNGLPFIRKDGTWNPEAFGDRYDLNRFERTVKSINTLSLAWFYSGDERYATKASELLNVWFLNSATRMNPNMNHASALPGVHDGMAIGIIFSVVLIEMLDHVKLLSLSAHWNNPKNVQLQEWFADYVRWLEESHFGKEERAATNNHGAWYTAQIATFSLFLDDKEKVLDAVVRAKKQLDEQIATDGSLPRELSRADAFGYAIYGLYAFGVIAKCASFVNCDLWSYQTPNHKGLFSAFHFMLPYLNEEKPWKWRGRVNRTNRSIPRLFGWATENYQTVELNGFMKSLNFELENGDSNRLYMDMEGCN